MALKEERERAGLSQAALSKAAGVSLRTVQYWERGFAGRARASSLARVAAALGCPIEALVEEGSENQEGKETR